VLAPGRKTLPRSVASFLFAGIVIAPGLWYLILLGTLIAAALSPEVTVPSEAAVFGGLAIVTTIVAWLSSPFFQGDTLRYGLFARRTLLLRNVIRVDEAREQVNRIPTTVVRVWTGDGRETFLMQSAFMKGTTRDVWRSEIEARMTSLPMQGTTSDRS
jgi:hypothetical protein